MGLNSGNVIVRALGMELGTACTVIGRTTHLAARLEHMAPPGSTLVTTSTHRLAEGAVVTQARGFVPVKGLAEPIEVYELVRAVVTPQRFRAAGVRVNPCRQGE